MYAADAISIQLASYLRGGPPMWMMHLHVNQNSEYCDIFTFSKQAFNESLDFCNRL